MDTQPEQYRYDGGPAAPIPMPKGNTRPLPSEEPNSSPAQNNRVTTAPAKVTWYAYGDRPKKTPIAPASLLVKEGHR
jgi:hypothetical protein